MDLAHISCVLLVYCVCINARSCVWILDTLAVENLRFPPKRSSTHFHTFVHSHSNDLCTESVMMFCLPYVSLLNLWEHFISGIFAKFAHIHGANFELANENSNRLKRLRWKTVETTAFHRWIYRFIWDDRTTDLSIQAWINEIMLLNGAFFIRLLYAHK